MPTPEDPDRYEALNQTQRQLAEEEEKRRIAEAEATRLNTNPYEALKETQRQVGEQEEKRVAAATLRADSELINEAPTLEAKLLRKQLEFDWKVRLGMTVTQDDIRELRQLDSSLAAQIAQEEEHAADWRDPVRTGPGVRDREARNEDQTEGDASKKEATAAEHDRANRGEITDVRAARLERLRGIDQQIKREFREQADNMLGRDDAAGDRSR